MIGEKYPTFKDALLQYPILRVEGTKPATSAAYKAGDVIVEDRSIYIGTRSETEFDQTYPIVRLEILEVVLEKGIYWAWNIDRKVNTVCYIEAVDKSEHIKLHV